MNVCDGKFLLERYMIHFQYYWAIPHLHTLMVRLCYISQINKHKYGMGSGYYDADQVFSEQKNGILHTNRRGHIFDNGDGVWARRGMREIRRII